MKRFSLVRDSRNPEAGVCVLRFVEFAAPDGRVSGAAECVDCGVSFALHCADVHPGACGAFCGSSHLRELDAGAKQHVCRERFPVTADA